jgi:hypothetical protein
VAVLSLFVLTALFLPTRDPIGDNLTIGLRPSALLAGLLFFVAIVAVIRPRLVSGRAAPWVLAVLTALAALVNLVDAAAASVLAGGLDLYLGAAHVLAPLDTALSAWGTGRLAAAAVGFAVAIGVAIAVAYCCWRGVLAALADRHWALGGAIVLGVALIAAAWAPPGVRPLSTGLGRDVVSQAAAVEAGWEARGASDGRVAKVLAAPAPPQNSLAGLKQSDVYLVFIDSYGTTMFDTPEFRDAFAGALAQFEAAVSAAGYTVASNRLVSPTFGGGSWLARATLASGIRLDDPVLYSRMLASGRKLLPAYFRAAGWRSLDVEPGRKAAAPDPKAWGFDRALGAGELDYRGPPFGWFAVPDQFTIERLGEIRASLGAARPVFAQIALVSSHIPFNPVPPYLADWNGAGTFADLPKSTWPAVYRQSDWSRLAPDYVKSLEYDFAVLRDWLCRRLQGKALVILVGDHQPPPAVNGSKLPWTVPIHILSRDPALVAPFLAAGYVGGMVPSQSPPHPGMESFLKVFLAAYGRRG